MVESFVVQGAILLHSAIALSLTAERADSRSRQRLECRGPLGDRSPASTGESGFFWGGSVLPPAGGHRLGLELRCRLGSIVDFVVAGLGFGALLIVIGFAVRDLGPFVWRFPANASEDDLRRELIDRTVLCHAIAKAFTIAGGITLVATAIAVAAGVGDSTGELVFALAAAVSSLFAAIAGALAIRQFQAARTAYRPTPAMPRPVTRSSPLSTADGGALTSVRRVTKTPRQTEQPVPTEADQPEPAALAAEIAAFDPNKLFASEFDHEADDDDPMLPKRLTAVSPEPKPEPEPVGAGVDDEPTPALASEADRELVEVAIAVEQIGFPETVETEAEGVEASQPPAAVEPPVPPQRLRSALTGGNEGKDEVLSVTIRPIVSEAPKPPATPLPADPEPTAAIEAEPPVDERAAPEPAPTGEPIFQSSLLADIGAGSSNENGAGFSSNLLADVDAECNQGAGSFQSPLLADLVAGEVATNGVDGAGDEDEGDLVSGAEPKRRSLFSRRTNHR
jgi:hypothetical protein